MNGLGQPKSANFNFLRKRFAELERIGALSEHYFTSDPIVALVRIRQFGELLAQIVAARSWLTRKIRKRTFFAGCGSRGAIQPTFSNFFTNCEWRGTRPRIGAKVITRPLWPTSKWPDN